MRALKKSGIDAMLNAKNALMPNQPLPTMNIVFMVALF
jgi:hypothetical protein